MDKTAGTDLVSEVKEYQSSIAQNLSVNVMLGVNVLLGCLEIDLVFILLCWRQFKFTHNNLSCESKNNA